MKIKFRYNSKQGLLDSLNDEELNRIARFATTLKEGQELELIIRKAISWDTLQMRRYFEGPVVSFIQECENHRGNAVGKGEIREGLKAKFLGWTEPNVFGVKCAVSTKTLDEADGISPREKWKDFLRQINYWCMDEYGYGLPSPDSVDEGS